MTKIGEIKGGGPVGMKALNSDRLWAKIARWFPERQIYHRAEGKVSYMTVSTTAQLVCVGAVVILFGWVAFASTSFALRGRVIDMRNEASEFQIARYERLLQEARSREASALALLETRTEEFQTVAADFEQRHAVLRAIIDPAGEALGDQIPTLFAGLSESSSSAASQPGASQAVMLRRDTGQQPATARLDALRAEQERMMELAETAAQSRIAAAREAIRVAGLSVEDLVSATEGVGGPLVDLDFSQIAPDVSLDEEFSARITEVAAHVAEAEELERAIASAPLRSPLTVDYRLTSRFGGRVDPLTRSSAYHTGLDMAAYHRAPVVSTATGVVSFAGWKGGYGRTIEIDHGNGFKTRYGHLSQIGVEVGDTVTAGDQIGSMGSTGRSTGTHLHYEVWFRGRVQDPAKYLRAGRHVQQG